jgi:hypothetical protein
MDIQVYMDERTSVCEVLVLLYQFVIVEFCFVILVEPVDDIGVSFSLQPFKNPKEWSTM